MTDAFGRALWDHNLGRENSEEYITEREDGIENSAKVSHYFHSYPEWEDLTKEAMEFIRDDDIVLDIGCGAGRHALWLQSVGQDIVAVDQSSLAVKTCQERGLKNCEVMEIDDLKFDDDTFDTVLVIGNIIGLGGRIDNITQLLDELDRITTKDGRIIADTQDPFTNGAVNDNYLQLNQIDNYEATSIRFRVRYKDIVGDWIELLMIDQAEWNEIVSETPWHINEFLQAQPDEGWYSIKALWYYVVLDK